MAQTPEEYEAFVRDVCQTLLNAQGLETVKAQHDVELPGLSRTHQIDVYWEYRLGGALHRVIINCKRYQGTVELNDVLTLKGVLDDFPGAQGLIVTTVGFQKGALDYARKHGIGLKVIRPPTNEDYGDKLRVLSGTVLPRHYTPLNISVGVDKPWLDANVPAATAARWNGPTQFRGADLVEDRVAGVIVTLNELWGRAITESAQPLSLGESRSRTLNFADAYLRHSDLGTAKLNELTFTWTLIAGEPVSFEVRFDYSAIVRDALDSTLLYVDDRGVVSGDVDLAAPRLTKPSA